MGLLKRCMELVKCKSTCAYNDDFCQDRFKTQLEEINQYKMDYETAKKLSMLIGRLKKKEATQSTD